ncbi:MAG: hypothetical protein JW931_04830 [Methanomicrobiaceae archaeon]|nr:hypothetical protein [Methanomicrobiaceae archaeon]
MIITGNESNTTDTGGKSPFILAKRYGRTVVSADPETGMIRDSPNDDRIFETFRYLDSYNNEKISKN